MTSVQISRHPEERSERGLIGSSLVAGLIGGVTAVSLAWQLDARSRRRREAHLHRMMVDLLLNALNAGDAVTERHSRRVADLADVLFSAFGVTPERHAMFRLAALLHDMGKIDDRFFQILHTAAPLTDEQRRQIEQHPHEGAYILHPLEAIHPGIMSVVEAHHECWDGSGYPRRLAGEQIPLGARIISVADVFDALTQPRQYRDPLDVEDARDELKKGAGTRFDPEVVRTVSRPEVWERWTEIVRRGRSEEEHSPEFAR